MRQDLLFLQHCWDERLKLEEIEIHTCLAINADTFYITHLLLQKSTKLFLNIFIDTEMKARMKDRPNRGCVNTSFSTFRYYPQTLFILWHIYYWTLFWTKKDISWCSSDTKANWFEWSIGGLIRTAIMHSSFMLATIRNWKD